MRITDAFLIMGGYILGSVPFGLLIGKIFYRIDIRQKGSGNPGATNVWRVLGAGPGLSTLALDIIKGVLAVMIARVFKKDTEMVEIFAGIAAIMGHNWSLFLKFRGGKGVATTAGVFLALLPAQTGLAFAGFLIFFFISGHVSVGSMVGAVVLFLSTFLIPVDVVFRVVIILASTMILLKHIPNMKRLAQGCEPKVSFKKGP